MKSLKAGALLLLLGALTPFLCLADEDRVAGTATNNIDVVPPNITDPDVVNIAAPDSGIFMSRDIEFYEAHWQGMDVMLLDAELRQKLRYPKSLKGIIVGEVTLNASLSGMLGGDVIIAVEGNRVTTLRGFRRETRTVQTRNHAALTVLRKTNAKNGDRYIMNRLVYILRARNPLGFAQVESAPMILPGDQRPHPYRGACTKCHSIGEGQFNMPDPDLITLPPPKITPMQLKRGISPHTDRGACLACHQTK
jgi:hypothetical protein